MRNRAFTRFRARPYPFRYRRSEAKMNNGTNIDASTTASTRGHSSDMEADVNDVQPDKPEHGKARAAIKRILPHVLLLAAAALYILGGGYAFYMMERDHRPPDHPPNAHNDPDPEPVVISRRSVECSPALLNALVDAARRECVLKANQNGTHETHVRYCSTLLLRLGNCLKPSGEKLGPLDDPLFPTTSTTSSSTSTSTTTTTTTTTTPSTTTSTSPPTTSSLQKPSQDFETKVRSGQWTPSTCTFMAFTIISTIGYGDVAPVTLWGRLFCIAYGLFGIPLALLTIADQGRFLTEFVLFLYKKSKFFLSKCYRRSRHLDDPMDVGEEEDDTMPAMLLLGLFALYLLLGGYIFTLYENQWSYVDAVYFIFVSSATIGFGDLLPSNQTWLPFTLLYIALGLALATSAIDICAEYLRRLHHFGAKLRNCANKFIWFGGKRVTIGELVRVVGTNLGVAEDKIQSLVDNFDAVIKEKIIEKEIHVPSPPPPHQPPKSPTPPESESTMPQESFSVQIPFIDSPCTSDRASLRTSVRTSTIF